MKQKFTENQKRAFVTHYLKGVSAKELYTKNNIPKSTFYDWVNRYSEIVKGSDDYRFYTENLKTQSALKKRDDIVKILQSVDCKKSDPLQIKLKEMENLYQTYSVHALCEALDVSRGTFYNHVLRNKKDKKAVVLRREMLKPIIYDIFHEYHQVFGVRRIRLVLEERGFSVSPRLISELMSELNISPIGLKAKKLHKRDIEREKKENLLKNNFKVNKPNKVWVSDFTSIRVKNSIFYLCVIIDLYSRKVISYSVSESQTSFILNKTLKNAVKSRNFDNKDLIFHSDRGSQFTSNSFRVLLKQNNITQSLSEKGNPYNNSVMESFFSHAKTEEFYRRIYKGKRDFVKSVDDYIERYNNLRPHSTNSNISPNKKEELYYRKHNFSD